MNQTQNERRAPLQNQFSKALKSYEEIAARFVETGDKVALKKAQAELEASEEALQAYDDGAHILGERQRAKEAAQAKRARETASQERRAKLLAVSKERTKAVVSMVDGLKTLSTAYANFQDAHREIHVALSELKPEIGIGAWESLIDKIRTVHIEDLLRRHAERSNLQFLEGFTHNPYRLGVGELAPDPVAEVTRQDKVITNEK